MNADGATSNPGHDHQGLAGPVADPAAERDTWGKLAPAAERDTWGKLASVGNHEYSCDMGFPLGEGTPPEALGSSRPGEHGSGGRVVPG